MSETESQAPSTDAAPAPVAATRNGHAAALVEDRPVSVLTGLPEAPVRLTREDIDLIKATVGREAKPTDSELVLFARLCESWQLNPFLREIWMIRYKDGGPLSIFASRDGMLRAARRDPEYVGPPVAFAVREADEFALEVDGDAVKVTHRIGKPPRGAILGAWCRVPRAGKNAWVGFVDFAEYRKATTYWSTYPEQAIVKCAEAMGLKHQFGLSGLSPEGDAPDDLAESAPAAPALPAPEPPTAEQIEACADGLARLGYTQAKANQRMASVRTQADAETLLQSIRDAEESGRSRTTARVGRRDDAPPSAAADASGARTAAGRTGAARTQQPPAGRQGQPEPPKSQSLQDLLPGTEPGTTRGPQSEPGERG